MFNQSGAVFEGTQILARLLAELIARRQQMHGFVQSPQLLLGVLIEVV
jgi:hypothetical protein